MKDINIKIIKQHYYTDELFTEKNNQLLEFALFRFFNELESDFKADAFFDNININKAIGITNINEFIDLEDLQQNKLYALIYKLLKSFALKANILNVKVYIDNTINNQVKVTDLDLIKLNEKDKELLKDLESSVHTLPKIKMKLGLCYATCNFGSGRDYTYSVYRKNYNIGDLAVINEDTGKYAVIKNVASRTFYHGYLTELKKIISFDQAVKKKIHLDEALYVQHAYALAMNGEFNRSRECIDKVDVSKLNKEELYDYHMCQFYLLNEITNVLDIQYLNKTQLNNDFFKFIKTGNTSLAQFFRSVYQLTNENETFGEVINKYKTKHECYDDFLYLRTLGNVLYNGINSNDLAVFNDFCRCDNVDCLFTAIQKCVKRNIPLTILSAGFNTHECEVVYQLRNKYPKKYSEMFGDRLNYLSEDDYYEREEKVKEILTTPEVKKYIPLFYHPVFQMYNAKSKEKVLLYKIDTLIQLAIMDSPINTFNKVFEINSIKGLDDFQFDLMYNEEEYDVSSLKYKFAIVLFEGNDKYHDALAFKMNECDIKLLDHVMVETNKGTASGIVIGFTNKKLNYQKQILKVLEKVEQHELYDDVSDFVNYYSYSALKSALCEKLDLLLTHNFYPWFCEDDSVNNKSYIKLSLKNKKEYSKNKDFLLHRLAEITLDDINEPRFELSEELPRDLNEEEIVLFERTQINSFDEDGRSIHKGHLDISKILLDYLTKLNMNIKYTVFDHLYPDFEYTPRLKMSDERVMQEMIFNYNVNNEISLNIINVILYLNRQFVLELTIDDIYMENLAKKF